MGADVLTERYRVRSTLGAGGMGQVVLAEDVVLGRPVALKRMHASAARQSAARFRREARVGASLSHPNLVSIYDIVDEGDDLVIVMEYVDGETLREALRRGGLPADRAIAVLRAVAAGLDQAHAHGVVHRDVKPANILLGLDGAVKLADLGVAAAVDRTQITTSGALLGTIPYMAPEQLEGAEARPAADVYALAAVAFEALSGRRARPEDNPLAVAHAVANRPPPDLRDAWPAAPPAVAAVLQRGMARDPGERPRSAGELVARLAEALAPGATVTAAPEEAGAAAARSPAPRRPPPSQRRVERVPRAGPTRSGTRRLAGAAAALLVLVAVVTAIVIGATGGSSRHPANQASAGAHRHQAASGRGSATTAAVPASGGTAAAAGSPTSAVESFYGLAAAHRYAQAWQLADPAFRTQLTGFNAFAAQQSHVSSIRFDQAATTAQTPTDATIAVQTTPVVNGQAQHCHGTVEVQRAAATASWLLHGISINC
jgi:serine/threonine-protein kinase